MAKSNAFAKTFYSNYFSRLFRLGNLPRLAVFCMTVSGIFLHSCASLPSRAKSIPPETIKKPPATLQATETTQSTSTPVSEKLFPVETEPIRTPTYDVSINAGTSTNPGNVVLDTPEPAITSTAVPKETSDLLYLSEGKLKRWDYVTNFSSDLVEGVVEYSVSPDTNQIAVLKSTNMSHDGKELFDLAVLDLNTKQLHYLLEKTPDISNIAISPDGKWVAYSEPASLGSISAIPLSDPDVSHTLGKCSPENEKSSCNQLSWSPESMDLLWSDYEGVWMAEFAGLSTSLVYSNTIQVSDPEGGMEEIKVTFDDFNWSPSGRFVLMDIVPSDYGVSWLGILDTGSKRMVQIPETYDYLDLDACASWTDNGDLLVGHSGGAVEPPLPYIDLWKVVPTHNELLVLEKKINFDDDIFSNIPNQEDLEIHYFPNWVTQISEDNIAFGLCRVDSDTTPILFQMDIQKDNMQEIIVVPYNSMDILWAPDRSGALIIGKNNDLIYAPFDGSLMRDLRQILGQDAAQFTWLPPQPRS